MLKWKTCLRFGVTAVLIYLAIYYWRSFAHVVNVLLGAAWPILLGAGIAYLINILMRFYEKHFFPKKNSALFFKVRRWTCMLLALLTIVAIVGVVVVLIVPELIKCIQLLLEEGPALLDRLNKKLLEYPEIAARLPWDAETLTFDWEETLNRVLNWLGGGLDGVVNSVVATLSGVFSGTTTLVMGVMFALYMLYSKEKLSAQLNRVLKTYLKPAWYEKTRYVAGVLDDSFHRYIVGQCLEAMILGTMCMLGMLLFGFPYATMIGALVGITALIPIAGAYIGAGVGAIMILTVSPVESLLFILYIIVLQQIEGNIIYPRVVGASLGLPALWVLAAITVGGGVLGIGGMLLGVPLVSALYRLLRTDMKKRSQCKKAAAAPVQCADEPPK